MIEICVEKQEANPWDQDTPQLREALRIISPLFKEDLATMRRVSKTWNKYVLELLNEQGFDEMKMNGCFQQLRLASESECEGYIQEKKNVRRAKAFTKWMVLIGSGASFGAYLAMFDVPASSNLKEKMAGIAYEMTQRASLGLTYQEVSRALRRLIALGVRDLCLPNDCYGTVYDCWEDLLNVSRPRGFEHYLVEDISVEKSFKPFGSSAQTYKCLLPLVMIVSLGILQGFKTRIERCFTQPGRESFESRLVHLKQTWKEMEVTHFSDPGLKRYHRLMKGKVEQLERDLAAQMTSWGAMARGVLFSSGYLLAGGLLFYGLIQSLAAAAEGDYEYYKSLFRLENVIDPTACSQVYESSIGLTLENCTRYLFDQEQLGRLFTKQASFDREGFARNMTYVMKIGAISIGTYFAIEEALHLVKQVRYIPTVYKTVQVMRDAFQSLKGSVSNGLGRLYRNCRNSYTHYTVND